MNSKPGRPKKKNKKKKIKQKADQRRDKEKAKERGTIPQKREKNNEFDKNM